MCSPAVSQGFWLDPAPETTLKYQQREASLLGNKW